MVACRGRIDGVAVEHGDGQSAATPSLRRSAHGARGNHPLAGLTRHPCDEIEVRVVVQDGDAEILRRRRDQKVRDLAAVLAAFCVRRAVAAPEAPGVRERRSCRPARKRPAHVRADPTPRRCGRSSPLPGRRCAVARARRRRHAARRPRAHVHAPVASPRWCRRGGSAPRVGAICQIGLGQPVQRVGDRPIPGRGRPAQCLVDRVLDRARTELCASRAQSGLVEVDQVLSHAVKKYRRCSIYPRLPRRGWSRRCTRRGLSGGYDASAASLGG